METGHTSLNLTGLALETLQQIAGHLHHTHRPSLYAFSLANETCHRAALPAIFSEVHLTVRNRHALQRDVDALNKILSRTDTARHVRYFSIKGSLRLDVAGHDDPKNEARASDDDTEAMAWFRTTGIDEILPDEEPILGGRHICHDEPVISRSSEEDMAWAPVVGLIQTFSRLDTLVYNCRNQFPPSLLDALHDYHPQCKLHHLTFRLRSLLLDVPDPCEMALATSPCLYGVKVACGERDSVGDDDYNEEATMELVGGLAPNLKEVVMVALMPEFSWKFRRPRAPWRGLPGAVPSAAIGSLKSLSIIDPFRWSPDILQTWAKYTDFGNLRRLALGGGYRHEYHRGMNDGMMEWIAQNCTFPRLKALGIRIERDDLYVEKPNYADNAIALFMAFEPLDELSVIGPLEPKILDAILLQHGPTLRKLTLRPTEDQFEDGNGRDRWEMPMVFGKEEILKIQAHCPLLQELTVSVKRTKSDTVEAEIYKSFGKMKRLRSLFLILDCSEWRVTRDSNYKPPFNEEDQEVCYFEWLKIGYLRDVLLNCAVDETLARSIWATIYQHKIGVRLESLKLWTTGANSFGKQIRCSNLDDVFDNLSRSWLIERVVEDVIEVRELGRRAREVRDQKLTDFFTRHWQTVEPERKELQIFRRVWPRKEGSKDWREDWSSLPLQV